MTPAAVLGQQEFGYSTPDNRNLRPGDIAGIVIGIVSAVAAIIVLLIKAWKFWMSPQSPVTPYKTPPIFPSISLTDSLGFSYIP